MLTKVINHIGGKIIECKLIATINYSKNKLFGLKRNTGEDLFQHSYRMLNKCFSLGIYDEEILQGILLHDLIEDTDVKKSDISNFFGQEVSYIVSSLTGVDNNGNKIPKDDYFHKFRNSCKIEWRILFIKLLDCIDNLETISGLENEKKIRFINEKKNIYKPYFI